MFSTYLYTLYFRYPNEELSDSMNVLVTKTSMARLDIAQVQLPEHLEVRKRLMGITGTDASSKSSLSDLSSDLVASPTAAESRKIRAPNTPNSPGPPSQTDWESSEVESTTDSFLLSSPSTTLLSDKISRLSTTHESETKESTHLNADDVPLLVSFVCCQSPSELFFRTTEMMQEFLKVHNALYTHFDVNGEASSEEPINFDVGFLCAVNHGGRWYRAQVVNMERYPEVVVFLLDRGVTCKFAASEIRRIPDELGGVQSTLIHCSLHGFCPPGGSDWNEKVTQL